MTLGDRIREFAEKNYGTLEALAKEIGMSAQQLSQYTTNKSAPGAKILSRFFIAGADLNWLITGEERWFTPSIPADPTPGNWQFELASPLATRLVYLIAFMRLSPDDLADRLEISPERVRAWMGLQWLPSLYDAYRMHLMGMHIEYLLFGSWPPFSDTEAGREFMDDLEKQIALRSNPTSRWADFAEENGTLEHSTWADDVPESIRNNAWFQDIALQRITPGSWEGKHRERIEQRTQTSAPAEPEGEGDYEMDEDAARDHLRAERDGELNDDIDPNRDVDDIGD